MHQTPFSAGAPPWTPLEAYDAPRSLSLQERDTCISPPLPPHWEWYSLPDLRSRIMT